MFRVLAALPNLSTSTEVWTIAGVWTWNLTKRMRRSQCKIIEKRPPK